MPSQDNGEASYFSIQGIIPLVMKVMFDAETDPFIAGFDLIGWL